MKVDADGLVRELKMKEDWQIRDWDHVLAIEFPSGITPEMGQEILDCAIGFSVREFDLQDFVTKKMSERTDDREKWDWFLCTEE